MVVLCTKITVLEQLCLTEEIICLQEHFLSNDSRNIFDALPSHMVHFVPAKKPKKRGRPSGGLATLISGHINSELFASSNHFLAVRVGETVIINVYLPTDYRDDCSEMKFALACKELGKCMNKISASHLHWILLGDFNCDISKSESSRSALLLSLIPNESALVPKAGDFTYIHLPDQFLTLIMSLYLVVFLVAY